MSATDRRATVNRLAGSKAGDGVLVIGTTPFIGKRFDAPALDTLFLAAPVSFDGLLVQAPAASHAPHPAKTPLARTKELRRGFGVRVPGGAPRLTSEDIDRKIVCCRT